MKTSRNIFNALGIEATYILCKKDCRLCAVQEIKGNSWIVATDLANQDGDAVLKIKYRGTFIYISFTIASCSCTGIYRYTYELAIKGKKEKESAMSFAFFQELKGMEQKQNEWNRRKEKRYDIGADEKKAAVIGFRAIEQKAYFAGIGEFPCVINNLSFSGAKLTTYANSCSKGMKACICLDFVSPIEQIPIMATIKDCSIENVNHKSMLSIVSVKFDDSPVEYKERLSKFIHLQEEKDI